MTNASAAQPVREIMLDKKRKVILDLNAFCLLEAALEKRDGNRNIFKAINWQDLNLRDFRLVLWASLMTYNPELSLEDVNRIVTLQHFQELKPFLDEMLSDTMPVPEPIQEGEIVPEKKAETTPTAG